MCTCCEKYEGTPPITKLQKLQCSGPGELLHIDFTTIEETIGLHEEPVIRNVLVMQDHFSKHIVAYVVKDQKARTTAEAIRSGYFGLFGAQAYLLSDKGKSFTAMVVEDLCTLYGVKKLRTSSYHAQTNGQVECMNQTLIRLIGKLDEDRKAFWSKYLPGAADGIQFHTLGSDGVQSSLPAFWQEAEDTSGLLVPNLARYASQV